MSYLIGMVKYIVKGPFTNPLAFYIFGAGVLASLNALPHLFDGSFIMMAFDYFATKYLPPTSLDQVLVQTVLGSTVAGVKWFLVTPRM
jgi:hypothetical protein